MGTLLPLPKRGRSPPPKFSAHVYCAQTAEWMKLVLGMEVGLSPGNYVLDGDPVHFPQKGAQPLPNFWAIFIVAKRLHASKYHFVWSYASAQATLC